MITDNSQALEVCEWVRTMFKIVWDSWLFGCDQLLNIY